MVDDANTPADRDALQASVKSAKKKKDGMEIVVSVHNPTGRALHYISSVRALNYDSATKTLRVGLSDKGLTLIPGGVAMLPLFRVIDPHSDAEFALTLPKTIVKLADAQPGSELAFEEHTIADAEEITVDIAWADTPFYEDPRDTKSQELPASKWEQDSTRIVVKERKERKKKK